jgi:hypothetical protein
MNASEQKVEHKCCKQVYPSGMNFPRLRPCGKRAFFQHDGLWYCSVHAPDAVAKRRQEADSKFKQKWDRIKWEHACVNACAGITDPQSAIESAREALKEVMEGAIMSKRDFLITRYAINKVKEALAQLEGK